MRKKLKKALSIMMTVALILALLPAVTPSASALAPGVGEPAPTYFAGGTGTAGDPYRIANAEQLTLLASVINGIAPATVIESGSVQTYENLQSAYYELTDNIVLNDTTDWENWNAETTGLTRWTAIGNGNCPFKGTFDGNSHTVSGIYIDSNILSQQGLFGYVLSGTVTDVGVINSHIRGGTMVGGVVGHNDRGTVQYCYNTGSITGALAGGVVGYIDHAGTVQYCYNMGSVSSSVSDSYIGGVVGRDGYDSLNLADVVRYCYNVGSVSGLDFVGGVVGYGDSDTVQYCYNAGSVSGTSNIGGVIGFGTTDTVQYCYNAGSVSGGSYVGGTVGNNNAGTVSNCYYDKQMCPCEYGIGNEPDTTMGKLTTEMVGQNLTSSLGIADNWVFTDDSNNLYPRLANMDTTDAAYVSATPLFLSAMGINFETVNAVYSPFRFGIENSVTWASSSETVISIYNDTGDAFVSDAGTTTLTATRGGVSKTTNLTVPMSLKTVDSGFDYNSATNPIAISSAAELIYVADKVNAGGTIAYAYTYGAGSTPAATASYQLTADIALNDETFTFDADTGLVKMTDGPNTVYIGTGVTGVTGDPNDSNATFDTTASTAASFYASDDSTNSGTYGGMVDPWTPIGTAAPFLGTFDGNDKTISGLYIVGTDNNPLYRGLFGSLGDSSTGATITNVSVSGCCVNPYIFFGGIAGKAYNTSIRSCQSNFIAFGGGSVGGISSDIAYSTSITDCQSSGVLCCNDDMNGTCGGMVGTSYASGDTAQRAVTGCSNTATVMSTSKSYGHVGGILGSGHCTSILDCSNSGNVFSYVDAGGIVGMLSSPASIVNCYNSGAVHNITTGSSTGGVIGDNVVSNKDESCEITNCYNAGPVSSAGISVGGIAGKNGGTITDCYYRSGCAFGGSTTQFGIGNATLNLTTADTAGWTTGFNTSCVISSSVAVGTYTGTNLVDALNAWVSAQTTPSDYKNWAADSGSTNDGYPVFYTAPAEAPTVTAQATTSAGTTGVTLNATVAGSGITDKGFYYSTTQPDDAAALAAVGDKIEGTISSGTLSAALTSLDPANTYYWVAYATNNLGTSYSDVQTLNSYAVSFSDAITAKIGETDISTGDNVFSGAEVTFTASDTDVGLGYAWTVNETPTAGETGNPKTLIITVNAATTVACTAAPLFSLVTPGSAYSATTNPIAVSSADDLKTIATLVNAVGKIVVNSNGTPIAMDAASASYRLTADIALNSDTSGYANWGTDNTGLSTWTPIGTYNYNSGSPIIKAFTGTFDGDNKTISGIYINGTSDYQGLFGYIGSSGTVKNVSVTESYIKGDYTVGVIAGSSIGSISNCSNSGNVSGGSYVGGIVGDGKNVSNCRNSGSVTAMYQNCGGIAGRAIGTVEGCSNFGTVDGRSTTGGIIGYSGANVQFCFNAGIVKGESTAFGGIIGANSASGTVVQYCYNVGGVSGADILGGIAGGTYDRNFTIQYCYSAGTVALIGSSGTSIGGILGYNNNSGTPGTVTNCYYDKQMCPYGGVNGADDETKNVVGKLTTDMIGTGLQSSLGTATNWVFTGTSTADGLYPMLKDMYGTDSEKVSVSPIFLAVTDSSKFETANRVKSGFTVSTVNSASWTSSDDTVISVSDTAATFHTAGDVTLTATCGTAAKVVHLTAVTNTDPIFKDTGAGSIKIKANADATDVAALLHVSDADDGQTLTWSQSVAPAHGTLTITGATATSGNNDVTPGGTITYAPTTDYTGDDSFTVQVSDAQGGAVATRTINVTVDGTAPTVTMSAEAVKGGATVKASSSEKGTVYLVSNALLAEAIDTVAELEALVPSSTATKATIITADSDTDISAPSAEGTYAAVAADEVGNVSAKSTNLITVDNTAPTIVSAKVSSDYKYIDVTFSEGVYSGAYTPVSAPAKLTFKQNGGTATGVTITLVTQTDGKTELDGGETTVRLFITVAGTPSGKETIEIKPTDGSSIHDEAGNYMAGTETTGEKVLYTPAPHGGNSGSTTTPSVSISIGGQSQAAATSQTATNSEGKAVKTVTIDSDKLERAIKNGENGATVTLPVTGSSAVAQGVLNGKDIKSMEEKEDVLVVKTDSASYSLPASQIDIDKVSKTLGADVSLADIKVTISISEPSDAMAKVIEHAAEGGGFTIAVPAVEYTISCEHGGKSVEVSSFNSYVQRTIAIPDGVDPSKITTGIVVDPDGTVHHVPTRITVIDGKYYAVINSLTNSAYSVVWNPVAFADVTSHWAKASINNMGSRMVVTGTGNNNYAPDRAITRAEFAAIMVCALGLEPGTEVSDFSDVVSTDWYCGYVETASEYGLITGYPDGTFGPNDKITREQAMAIVAKAMKITELEPSLTVQDVSALLAEYLDAATVSSYADESIAACISMGIVSGRPGNTIAPQDNITRAEVAVIVEQLLQKSGLI